MRYVVKVLASYLESESRVESGSEEEKAVGVAEGCLCVRYKCGLSNGSKDMMGFLLTLVRGGKGVFPCWSSLFLLPNLGVEEGCLGRKACSTSLHVDEDESVLGWRWRLCLRFMFSWGV